MSEIGLTEFITKKSVNKNFTLKKYYTDFVVKEIPFDDKLVFDTFFDYITSKKVIEFVYNLCGCFSENEYFTNFCHKFGFELQNLYEHSRDTQFINQEFFMNKIQESQNLIEEEKKTIKKDTQQENYENKDKKAIIKNEQQNNQENYENKDKKAKIKDQQQDNEENSENKDKKYCQENNFIKVKKYQQQNKQENSENKDKKVISTDIHQNKQEKQRRKHLFDQNNPKKEVFLDNSANEIFFGDVIDDFFKIDSSVSYFREFSRKNINLLCSSNHLFPINNSNFCDSNLEYLNENYKSSEKLSLKRVPVSNHNISKENPTEKTSKKVSEKTVLKNVIITKNPSLNLEIIEHINHCLFQIGEKIKEFVDKDCLCIQEKVLCRCLEDYDFKLSVLNDIRSLELIFNKLKTRNQKELLICIVDNLSKEEKTFMHCILRLHPFLTSKTVENSVKIFFTWKNSTFSACLKKINQTTSQAVLTLEKYLRKIYDYETNLFYNYEAENKYQGVNINLMENATKNTLVMAGTVQNTHKTKNTIDDTNTTQNTFVTEEKSVVLDESDIHKDKIVEFLDNATNHSDIQQKNATDKLTKNKSYFALKNQEKKAQKLLKRSLKNTRKIQDFKPQITYFGNKDKRAVTYQQICIQDADFLLILKLSVMTDFNLKIFDIKQARQSAKLGNIYGNTFEIVIRVDDHENESKHVQETVCEHLGTTLRIQNEIKDVKNYETYKNTQNNSNSSYKNNGDINRNVNDSLHVESEMTGGHPKITESFSFYENQIKKPGLFDYINIDRPQIYFINYFGNQRFGSNSDTHLIGFLLIKQEYEKLVEFVMKIKPNERVSTKKGKYLYGIGKYDESLKYLYNLERKIVIATKNKQTMKSIFNSMRREDLKLYYHACQSYLFNLKVSEVVKRLKVNINEDVDQIIKDCGCYKRYFEEIGSTIDNILSEKDDFDYSLLFVQKEKESECTHTSLEDRLDTKSEYNSSHLSNLFANKEEIERSNAVEEENHEKTTGDTKKNDKLINHLISVGNTIIHNKSIKPISYDSYINYDSNITLDFNKSIESNPSLNSNKSCDCNKSTGSDKSYDSDKSHDYVMSLGSDISYDSDKLIALLKNKKMELPVLDSKHTKGGNRNILEMMKVNKYERSHDKLFISFDLRSSVYATMAIRELVGNNEVLYHFKTET